MCTVRPKLGVFSQLSKYSFFCCFITRLVKKLQQWSLYEVIEDILPFVLNTKRPLSNIWLLSYKQNNFGCFSKAFSFWFFFENTQNCFAYNSATKYRSEAVLYSKRTAGYPLSHHVKTIAVAFSQLSNKATKKLYFEHFRKNTQLWAYGAHPRLRLKLEILFRTIFPAKIR